MFQDLFFSPLDPRVETRWDRELVLGILGRGAIEPVTHDRCRYPDGSGGRVHGIDPDDARDHLDYLCFERFGGRTMMERLFELADAVEAFLAWSGAGEGDPSACVARAERLERVGAEARGTFRFAVARDASHLHYLLRGRYFEGTGR